MKASLSSLHSHYEWLINYLAFVYNEFQKQKTTYTAAALTFTSLLSLVPLFAVSFSILRAFPAFNSFTGMIQDFIFQQLVPTSVQVVQQYLSQFVVQASKLTLLGSGFLVVTVLMTLMTIENTFNHIWHVPTKRRGVSAFLLYWSVLTLAPIGMGLSLLISSYLFSLPWIASTADTLGVVSPVLKIAPLFLEIVSCMLLYLIVPNCPISWRHALVGGITAGILLEISKKLFTWYLSIFDTYQLLYGAMAIIPIFLLWLYIIWLIVLLGAHVTHGLAFPHRVQKSISTHPLITIYFWLGFFWQAQQQGEAISLKKLVQLSNLDEQYQVEDLIAYMLKAKLIHQLENGNFVLTRDLSNYTFADLYRAMPWQLPNTADLVNMKTPWASVLHELLNKGHNCLDNALQRNLSDIYSRYPG